MALQDSISSDTTLSDFSAVLLKTGNNDQNKHDKGDKAMNISARNYASPENQNLSSLLSQIQDDGPAYNDSVKRNSFNNWKKNNDLLTGQGKTGLNSNHNIETSAEPNTPNSSNTDVSEIKTGTGTWLLFLLILSVSILSGATLVRLDMRTSELEESLSIYDTGLQESILSQNQASDLSRSIEDTNAALQSIQQEIESIKAEQEVIDDGYTEPEVNRISLQTDEVELLQDRVGVLRHEILVLKSELLAVKNKFISKNSDKNSTYTAGASKDLTVHLASLTNKSKAEKIVERLHEVDLFPFIQTVVVNGKQVYRLSVSGFSNRNQAEAFIHEAGEKYGLKDGWIRES